MQQMIAPSNPTYLASRSDYALYAQPYFNQPIPYGPTYSQQKQVPVQYMMTTYPQQNAAQYFVQGVQPQYPTQFQMQAPQPTIQGVRPPAGQQMNRQPFHHNPVPQQYLYTQQGSLNQPNMQQPIQYARGMQMQGMTEQGYHSPEPMDYPYNGYQHSQSYSMSSPQIKMLDAEREPTGRPKLDARAFDLQTVRGDGRCMFRAIARSIAHFHGNTLSDKEEEREADSLRTLAHQVISKDRREFFENSGAIEGDFKAYLKKMKDPSFYGGEPELLALSESMEVPIKVYMYEPGSFYPIAEYGSHYAGRQAIHLLYNGSNHYDALIKRNPLVSM